MPGRDFRRRLYEVRGRRGFLHDAGALTGATAFSAGLNAVQGLLLARWLGPTRFGLVALITTWPALIFSFFDAKSQDASIKFVGEYRQANDPDRAMAMCKLSYLVDLTVALATLLVTVLTASWAGRAVMHGLESPGLLTLFAASLVPSSLFTTSSAMLTVCARFSLRASMEVVLAVIRFLLVIGGLAVQGGVRGVIVGYAAGGVVTGAASAVIAYRVLAREFGSSLLSARVGRLIHDRSRIASFLGFTNLTELVKLAHKQLDIVLVGLVGGTRDAGIYRLAKSSAALLGLPLVPIISVSFQRMTRVSGRPIELRALTERLKRSVGLPLAVLTLIGGAGLAAGTILIAGPAYRSALPAIALWILAFAVWNYLFWLRPLYLTIGWVHQWFFVNLASAILYVAMGIPLLYSHGFFGLTLAITAAGIASHLVAMVFVKRRWWANVAEGPAGAALLD